MPRLAVIARYLDQAVIGANPNLAGAQRRRSNGVDHAATFLFWTIGGCTRVKVRRGAGVLTGEVRAENLPGLAAIHGAEKYLRPEI